jgi:hypothetical protein
MILVCDYEPHHTHEFPDDWQLMGPRGKDWRADPRWKPTTYVYLDEQLRVVWTTQVPKCLDEALDKFTAYRGYGPAYLQATNAEGKLELVPFKYDSKTDTVYPLEN